MNLYDIGFLSFCVIMICFAFEGMSKNILTQYGFGVLIAVIVIGIIGYDIWTSFQVREVMQHIDLTPSSTEKERTLQALFKYIRTQP
jgi:hypothetical protein